MTRRSLFGLLPAAAVAAVPAPGLALEWSCYEVRDGSNLQTSRGVQCEVKCCDPRAVPYIAGYEITFSWREDFLGRGNPESITEVVPPSRPFSSHETTGRESWMQITATALIRGMQTVETVKGAR